VVVQGTEQQTWIQTVSPY